MPILTPILLISDGSVRAPTHAGGKLTRVPEKNPYNVANTRKPCHVDIPSHPNKSIPAAATVGIRTLIGPMISAIKFGNIRPNTEAAYDQPPSPWEKTFIIERTYNETFSGAPILCVYEVE